MQYYFITGASRGIGRALVERALQEKDARVTGFSRSPSVTHNHYRHIAADLSDIAQLQQTLEELFPALEEPRRIVLINNAGTLGDVQYVGALAHDGLIRTINLNVTAPMLLVNQFVQAYRSVDAEKIVINVSSGAGKYPVDGWSAYCTSKAALDMFTQVAALEQQKRQDHVDHRPVRFYALAPGVVDTRMQDTIRQVDARQFSTLDKFLSLKQNNELSDPAQVSAQFFHLIQHPEQFKEVLQDVRKF